MKKLSKILFIFLLTSCSSSKIIELGGQAASKGIDVSQKGVEIYTILGKQADIDESQQNKVAILTNPNPGTMTLPNKHSRNFVKQLQPRLNAYKSLLNVYQEFNLLTDSKFGDKTKDAASALITSFNSINQLPDLPSAVSSMLPEVSKTISQSIQAKKVKKHNEILLAITNAYLKLWTEEESLWNAYI